MYFVGWLGPDALAGVSLVFPLIMLMQTMSAGGMGGGVALAVARALGAGRRQDADALALHALVIAGVMAGWLCTGSPEGLPPSSSLLPWLWHSSALPSQSLCKQGPGLPPGKRLTAQHQ